MSVSATSLFESALQAAPDAILLVDAAGCILFANTAAERLFGAAGAQLAGEPIEHLLPERLQARHEALRAEFLSAPRTRPMGPGFDLHARRRDGSEVPVEIALSPVTLAERTLVIAAIRDVSDRRRIEGQLGAQREAAEQARASACEAREFAERASGAKSRFLATASHDLRQPLQTLALLNGTLRRLTHDPSALDALQRQEQAIGVMTRLVNALLDIGKLESGAVRAQIEAFAARALLEPLQQEFAALAEQKGLALRVQVQDGMLRTDAALLEQVLRNLLSNALKYTVRGEILLRCGFEPPLAYLEIRDTGIGIAPQQLPLIFNEFFQVDTPAAVARSGYGLGLSIVSRIVGLLGLKLQVQSAPGGGTRFLLTVPAAPADAQAHGPIRCDSAPRILLQVSEAGLRGAAQRVLRSAGYEVMGVDTEADAPAAIESLLPIDLLISDADFAGTARGAQAMAALRARFGASLPAILLSADPSTDAQVSAPEGSWCTAHLPLRAEELLGAVGQMLART
ncbi:MAG: ATP-binding protein [Pseudomonadota bacterium]|nr:ATP-binding protein [Pseudomonadota bacterium]